MRWIGGRGIFGKAAGQRISHSGRKFEDVYLDHKSYVKWVLELGATAHVEFEVFSIFSEEIDGS